MVDRHVSFMERRVKQSKQPEWFTDYIKEAMYLHFKYSGENKIENVTFWWNKTTECIHKLTTTY